MSLPEPPRQSDDLPEPPFAPPPGWTAFCRVLPGFAAGSLLGALVLALLLVFDAGQVRTLLRSDTPPHWSIFLVLPLLSGLIGAFLMPQAGKSARR